MGNIAIRDAYGEALKELGGINDKVVVLEADVGGSSKSILFGREYPDRYYEVGISELNMVNMAAGMASEGLIPFTNTFSTFMATRGADPIQSLIGYDKLNVKLAGTYVGLSDSYDGASHHGITDMAFVRAIPNLTIITPGTPVEAKKAVFAAAEFDGPVYLRLSRAPAEEIYNENINFEIGKGIVVKDGTDVAIIVTGTLLPKAVAAAKALEAEGINAAVIDMHTVKPLDEELVLDYAKKTGAILTVEEESIYGGLYSAVAEVLAAKCPTIADGIGVTDFAESGNLDKLLEKYGFSAENIAAKAKALIARK